MIQLNHSDTQFMIYEGNSLTSTVTSCCYLFSKGSTGLFIDNLSESELLKAGPLQTKLFHGCMINQLITPEENKTSVLQYMLGD